LDNFQGIENFGTKAEKYLISNVYQFDPAKHITRMVVVLLVAILVALYSVWVVLVGLVKPAAVI
jgi:hypothetical protein